MKIDTAVVESGGPANSSCALARGGQPVGGFGASGGCSAPGPCVNLGAQVHQLQTAWGETKHSCV